MARRLAISSFHSANSWGWRTAPAAPSWSSRPAAVSRNGTIPAKQFRRRWIISRNQFHAWLDGTPESGD
jgi:hypothetical protein